MHDHDEKLHNLLIKQRAITKSKWKELSKSKILKGVEFTIGFAQRLANIRKQTDLKEITWDDSRKFYPF